MKSTAAGIFAAILFIPLLFVSVISPASQQTAQPAPAAGGGLNTAKVPSQFLAVLQQAGTTCTDYPPALQAGQIEAESNWVPTASSGVAYGIAQFTRETAALYHIDPMDPNQAIPAMAKMMCQLASQVKADMASHRITKGTLTQNMLAAYNCGLGCVEAAGGFPVGINETDNYVPKILTLQSQYTSTTTVTLGGATVADVSPNGPCPLGPADNGTTCNQAIQYELAQAAADPPSAPGQWHNRCLNMVTLAYGGEFAGIGAPTYYAVQSAAAVQAAGLMQPPTTNYAAIPRGAVIWYSSPTGAAGHVVISVGGGMALSTDVPDDSGHIGEVPIAFFEQNWHQTMIGWSPPRV